MRRRSRAGGEPEKARRRKTQARKSGITPKAVGPRSSSAASLRQQVALLTRERDEALQQQTATADVLKVISRSTFDLQSVLNTLVDSAARLCAAEHGLVFQRDGQLYRLAASYGISREVERFAAEHPLRSDRGSVTARAGLEGRAIHIPDVLTDPEFRATDHQRSAGIRTILCVPLLREGTTTGVFSLSRTKVKPFTEKQIELVTTFAAQAVIAIENARLLNELRQRTADLTERTADLTEALEQQTATSEVLRVISSSPGDLQAVFASMLENAVRICDATFGNIYRWDGEALHMLAAQNTPPAFAESRRRLSARQTYMRRMVERKDGVHVADLAASELTSMQAIRELSPPSNSGVYGRFWLFPC